MMLNARKPHFLDVFLPNLSSNRLKVPSKFVHHLRDRTSGSLSLIGPSGNRWRINLFEYDGHLFFREGWPTFVKDHDLQCGDTLVFGYDGDSEFTVQIFDESSCEKDETFSANCSQRSFSQGASDNNEILGKKIKRDIEEASLLKLVDEKKMRSSAVPSPQVSSAARKRKQKLKKCAKKKKKIKKTVSSDNDMTLKNNVMASDKEVVFAVPAMLCEKSFLEVEKSMKKKQNKRKTDNKKPPTISKFIEARAAHYFNSTFPYFFRVMCYSNISGNSTLKIPSHFSSMHLPNRRIKITLMNLNGDCWLVNSIPNLRRSTTMHTICGGWIAFVRANNIKIEDVCIFELVGEFEFRVRILQLGLGGLERQLGSQSIFDDDGVELGERCLEMIENVAEDTKLNPLKDLDVTIEQESYIQQETGSSIDTVDIPIAALDPACASASPLGNADNSTSDELLLEFNGGGMSYQTSGNQEQGLHTQPLAEAFTSPFPNFTKVMMSSSVDGSYRLPIPRKFSAAYLPSHKMEVILRNLRGESWNVVVTRDGKQMLFCGGWISFARMNNLKVGDVCVFELLGERELQARILEGSQKIQEHVHNEAVFDESTASNVSTECSVHTETKGDLWSSIQAGDH